MLFRSEEEIQLDNIFDKVKIIGWATCFLNMMSETFVWEIWIKLL